MRLAAGLLVLAWVAPLHAKLAILPGSVTVSDAAAVPPGCVLHVTLHDMSPGVAKDASVAQESFEAEGMLPIRFELHYAEDSIEPKRLYGVAALITNSRGAPLWETRVPIRVLTLGNQKKVDLLLRPVEKPKAAPEPNHFTLECGELRFDVRLDDKSATITGADSKVKLPRVEATAGKKFSDGGTIFSVFGQAVYFQRPGQAYRDCKVVPAEGKGK